MSFTDIFHEIQHVLLFKDVFQRVLRQDMLNQMIAEGAQRKPDHIERISRDLFHERTAFALDSVGSSFASEKRKKKHQKNTNKCRAIILLYKVKLPWRETKYF